MVDSWIEKFQREAMPKLIEEFKPQKVIIFGSRVRGAARKDSDIDVIMISPDFAKIPFVKRMATVLKKVPFTKHVDYICYTPEEFDKIKNESSTIMDAIEDSIEIPL